MSVFFAGMMTGWGLIVAIGAQNAFVLRQGIARRHVGPVVAICAVSDALLIAAGVTGIGAVVSAAPWVLAALRWVGAAYLLGFGVLSLWRARRPSGLHAETTSRSDSRRAAALTALALTYLNPHVYLDTVLMLGSIANQFGPQGKWVFGAGATVASLVWFTAIGYAGRALSGVLGRPRTWRILDLVIGLTMMVLAWRLVSS